MLSPYLFFVLFITRTNVIVIISDCNYYHLPFFFHSSHLEALFLYPLLAIIYEHLEKFDFLFYFSLLSSPFFPAFLQFAPSLFFSHPSSRNGVSNVCFCRGCARVVITTNHVPLLKREITNVQVIVIFSYII